MNLDFGDEVLCELDAYDQALDQSLDSFADGVSTSDEIPACLTREFSELEPELTPEGLAEVDRVAMLYEVRRLVGIDVIEEVSGPQVDHRKLSTRFVWKEINGRLCWLRRARLVAREFAFLDPGREDLYSPASSSLQSRVIPSLFMSNRGQGWCMCSLDVSDAYFNCLQGEPTCTSVRIGDQVVWFRLLRCLPGQRDGSARWFSKFSETLQTEAGAELMPELPSLFRLTDGSGKPHAAGLIHVDDMLSAGRRMALEGMIEKLKGQFQLRVEWICNTGDEIQFLKKRHFLLSDHELIIQVNGKHLSKLRDLTGNPKVRKSPLPSGRCETDGPSLEPERAGLYRQSVGVLLYLQADMPESQFAIRLLSTCVSNPTVPAWALLRHLVGYLTHTSGHCICLEAGEVGVGLKIQTPGENVIEGFSDSIASPEDPCHLQPSFATSITSMGPPRHRR